MMLTLGTDPHEAGECAEQPQCASVRHPQTCSSLAGKILLYQFFSIKFVIQ